MKHISEQTGRSVISLAADLAVGADLARVEKVLRHDASITLLVNNAGVGAIMPLLTSDIDAMEQLIAVNVNGVYGASKAYVLALTQSLQHELAAKGVRVQAVLPGATATEFWALAGRPVEQIPQEMVMTAEDLVDAALAGLDRGEIVSIPSLPEASEWDGYEAARRAMTPRLSSKHPAMRFAP